MKRLIIVGIIVAMLCMICPQIILADTVQYITITATGSEVDFTCNQTGWDVGTVFVSDNKVTGYNWGKLTNDGSEAVDVSIAGDNMTDATDSVFWVLSDTATAGAAIFGMRCGLTTDNVIIKGNTPFNYLVEGLAGSGATQAFGLEFLAPTSTIGNLEMEMVGATNVHNDSPRGLILTGTIHV